MALCDSNEIPSDANRDTVRIFTNSRGIKAAGKVVQDVVGAGKYAESGELKREHTLR